MMGLRNLVPLLLSAFRETGNTINLTPDDLIAAARRRAEPEVRVATKDRSAIKAARKQSRKGRKK